MFSFLVSLVALVAGYFIYGRVVEKVFGVDSSRKTPAITKADGVDYIPMPAWKVYMIQFLNIAGTGPIFGAIMGAKFGPSAYLWIVFGCIFAGAVHDYMTGMLSIRNNGAGLTDLVGEYLHYRADAGRNCIRIQPGTHLGRHRRRRQQNRHNGMGGRYFPLLSFGYADAYRQDYRTYLSGIFFRVIIYGCGTYGMSVREMASSS